MNGQYQELGIYKAYADSIDGTAASLLACLTAASLLACLLACFGTLDKLLNFSGPQYTCMELEALGEEEC